MEDLLIEVLSSFGYPVKLQGSLAKNERYPEHFFTFWENEPTSVFFDNKEHITAYDYDVNFYSTDPEKVYTVPREAIKKLSNNGFSVSGDGYSVGSDEPTHDGRGTHVLYLQTK